ncbi:hypothetical protein LOK49_LG13G00023 [Camellia lanceoleosa]|uniref:Uncharacterized protein n=1 Tax=Camellia lanceoleosa TaxID=1840588 RepID=A0ACC0FFW8_9ERIC|nr:hypothetical protein LOK49_LG13G00023 [Camellia lanceoleosa]
MIGRADIGDQKQRRYERYRHKPLILVVTFSTPLASNSRSKGSLGHAFTVQIRIEIVIKRSFYPSLHTRLLAELILGHQVSLTDVPPQPNSPPDNVFRSITRAGLGPKRGQASKSIVTLGRPPKRGPLIALGRASLATSPRHEQPSNSPTMTGSDRDPVLKFREPILFPLRIHFADFPCLHCSIDRRSFHLGDRCVMSTTGVEALGPPDFQGHGRPTPRDAAVLFQLIDPTSYRAASVNSRPGSSYPEGNFGGNQLLDGSISLSPLYPSRFNDLHRQDRRGPPPEFPLASPRSGIVHHLSGPDRHARTRTLLRRSRSVDGATREGDPVKISFLAPYGFTRPLTRTHVRLLGPCFKTGRMGSSQAGAGSAQMPKHARGRHTATIGRRLPGLLDCPGIGLRPDHAVHA